MQRHFFQHQTQAHRCHDRQQNIQAQWQGVADDPHQRGGYDRRKRRASGDFLIETNQQDERRNDNDSTTYPEKSGKKTGDRPDSEKPQPAATGGQLLSG